MLNAFLYPNGITYFVVKLIILALAITLWLVLTTAPVV